LHDRLLRFSGLQMNTFTLISGPEHNADLLTLVTIRADELPWQQTGLRGVEEKLFERIPEGREARETALFRLAPGVALAGGAAECRVDIYVLEGIVVFSGRLCLAGHFLRIPRGTDIALQSPEGATIMLKKRSGDVGSEAFVLDTKDRANWALWGGRGSEKAQIYDPGSLFEASWVGYMLPDLTIPEHDHAGGEEIFILEGELRDERGLYGPGTWVRFPVGVKHTPTSLSQGCLMIVREGDARPLS
jgi:hypothetical protein